MICIKNAAIQHDYKEENEQLNNSIQSINELNNILKSQLIDKEKELQQISIDLLKEKSNHQIISEHNNIMKINNELQMKLNILQKFSI